MSLMENFYIVAREPGQQTPDLPTWADKQPGNVKFTDDQASQVTREDITQLPGAFILHDVLSHSECQQFIDVTTELGYHLDAPVSLPHSVRHNTNINWIVEPSIEREMWSRCEPHIPELVSNQPAVGLNARFRFYRYETGDFFKPHTDGAWPGSQVVNGELQHDAFGDRLSQLTCLLFLTDAYRGGRTAFFTGPGMSKIMSVATPKGAGLFFPHGYHPQQYLHAGEIIEAGVKMIIRTDVLFLVGR